MTEGTGVLVTVIGEALIDLIPGQAPGSFTACPAGSPFNVAIGLARLGQSTALMARKRILALARSIRDRGGVLVSYDPNIRPRLLGDPDRGRRMAEAGVRLAHLVKASAEDIGWLYPGWSAAEVAGHWLRLGPAVVVITDSARGADAFTAAGPPVHRPAREVTVVDTTGAGDSFTSGLLSALIGRGLHSPAELARRPGADLTPALDDAILAASLTCQRSGAEPGAGCRRPCCPCSGR